MDLVFYFRKALQIVLFNKKVITKVSKDKNSTLFGILFLSIGIIPILIVQLLQESLNINHGIAYFFYILAFVLGYGIALILILTLINYCANILGGKGKFVQIFRPLALSSLLDLLAPLTLLPFLGPLIDLGILLWSLALSVFIIKEVYKLTTWKSIAVLLLAFLILIIIGAILFVIFILVVGISAFAS